MEIKMSVEEAKEKLDQQCINQFVHIDGQEKKVQLDGEFTVGQLKAILVLMCNQVDY